MPIKKLGERIDDIDVRCRSHREDICVIKDGFDLEVETTRDKQHKLSSQIKDIKSWQMKAEVLFYTSSFVGICAVAFYIISGGIS
jgi:predicted  nucleic acid-binding Zn-ribbon protein